MGQPNWADWAVGDPPILSARQREWLVTMADDVVVEVVGNDEHGGLEIVCHHNGERTEDVVPWEGHLSQPVVRLVDPEQSIDDLPSTERPSDA